MAFLYKMVACGGTFGPLHKGHEYFLKFAFSFGEKVLIGLTSDAYVAQNKKDTHIPSFTQRKKYLEEFLQKNNLLQRSIVIPIDSVFGPITENIYPVEALITTEDTKKGALDINMMREKNDLPSLPVISCSLMQTNGHLPLSSTHIRSGFMDMYGNTSWFTGNLSLPIVVREQLHEPFGTLLAHGIKDSKKIPAEKIVTVGDVTTKQFIKNNIIPKLSIIDFVIERKKTHETIQDFGFTGREKIVSVANPAGLITVDTWKILLQITQQLFTQNHFIIEVLGEEDLLVLPVLLVLPEGFYVFYGQPGKGLVQIEVTKETKKRASELINRFVSL